MTTETDLNKPPEVIASIRKTRILDDNEYHRINKEENKHLHRLMLYSALISAIISIISVGIILTLITVPYMFNLSIVMFIALFFPIWIILMIINYKIFIKSLKEKYNVEIIVED